MYSWFLKKKPDWARPQPHTAGHKEKIEGRVSPGKVGLHEVLAGDKAGM